MGQILVYSIISSVVLASMYLIYKIALASEKQYSYNRAVLLTVYAVALASPLMIRLIPAIPAGEIGAPDVAAVAAVAAERPSVAFEEVGTTAHGSVLSMIPIVLAWVYLAGVVAACVMTILTVFRLGALIHGGRRIDFDRFTVIVYDSSGVAPFSWHRYIIMSKADFEGANGAILTHELCHIKSLHWIDLLIAQLVIIFQWYNPAAWLMREELMLVHEYQADEAVIRSGADLRQYQMLLIKKAVGGRFQSLANSLNHSNLKKRITMMYKSKSSVGRRFRALVLVPAALVAVASVANPAVASALDAVSQTIDGDKVTKNDVTSASVSVENDEEKVFNAPEVPPQYPGGEAALLRYLAENIRYPEKAFKENVQGRVVVMFVVNSKGEVTSPKIIRGRSPEIDAEALRVVSTIKGFKPGTVGGKPVSVYYTVPITFRLTGSSSGTPDSTPSAN